MELQVAGEHAGAAGFPFNSVNGPVETDVEACLLRGAVKQGRVALVHVEVCFKTGDIGFKPAFECEYRRFDGMIVLDELLDVSARDGRTSQNLGALRCAEKHGKGCGSPTRASETLRQSAQFMQQQLWRPRQFGVWDKLAVKPGVSLAHVGNQSQAVFDAELMNDVAFAVNKFSPELDGVTGEGAPGENAASDTIASLHADRRKSAA